MYNELQIRGQLCHVENQELSALYPVSLTCVTTETPLHWPGEAGPVIEGSNRRQ